MRIGIVQSVNTNEDTCEVTFPNGLNIRAVIFTDKIPDIGSSVVVVKDEFSQMYLVIAVKNDMAKKEGNFILNPFKSFTNKLLVENSDKLPGDFTLVTESGSGLGILSSGASILKASLDNILIMENKTNSTLLKSDKIVFSLPDGKMLLSDRGLYFEYNTNSTKSPNYATEKFLVGENISLVKNLDQSSPTFSQSKIEIKSYGSILLSNRDVSLNNGKTGNQQSLTDEPQITSCSKIELTPNKDIYIDVAPEDDSSTQKRLHIGLDKTSGDLSIFVGDANIDSFDRVSGFSGNNNVRIILKDDLSLEVYANNNISVETPSNISINAGGNIDMTASGNVNIVGATINLN